MTNFVASSLDRYELLSSQYACLSDSMLIQDFIFCLAKTMPNRHDLRLASYPLFPNVKVTDVAEDFRKCLLLRSPPRKAVIHLPRRASSLTTSLAVSCYGLSAHGLHPAIGNAEVITLLALAC